MFYFLFFLIFPIFSPLRLPRIRHLQGFPLVGKWPRERSSRNSMTSTARSKVIAPWFAWCAKSSLWIVKLRIVVSGERYFISSNILSSNHSYVMPFCEMAPLMILLLHIFQGGRWLVWDAGPPLWEASGWCDKHGKSGVFSRVEAAGPECTAPFNKECGVLRTAGWQSFNCHAQILNEVM